LLVFSNGGFTIRWACRTKKSKLHNLQYDEGGNHMSEAEPPAEVSAMRISPAPALSQDTPSQPNQLKQDLVDTFDLFKTYLDHKLHDLKSDIISEQENLSLKDKEQVNLKFKNEGNKIQFRFIEEIAADLAKLQKHCTSSVNNSLVTDICDKLKSRNKLILFKLIWLTRSILA
jgi:hypothetical protein